MANDGRELPGTSEQSGAIRNLQLSNQSAQPDSWHRVDFAATGNDICPADFGRAPVYTDCQLHDRHAERVFNEPGHGPITSFSLQGIKDSPEYLHNGRSLTLTDTVEFFNLVFGLKLTQEKKADLMGFRRRL